jgi:hypothetical protein
LTLAEPYQGLYSFLKDFGFAGYFALMNGFEKWVKSMDTQKNIVFVAGAAGTGTNAFVDLLNTHSRLCIAKDRFPLQYQLQRNFSPSLFKVSRFCDLRYTDRLRVQMPDEQGKADMDSVAEKWGSATWVGDRFEGDLKIIEDALLALPASRCLLALRNLKDVAIDWDGGLARYSSGLCSAQGFAEGCSHWSKQIARIQALVGKPEFADRIFLVDLDHCFEHDVLVRDGILGFLGLDNDPDFITSWDSASEQARRQHMKGRKVPKDHVATYKKAMTDSIRQLRRLAMQKATHYRSFV